ncbi:ribonuclease HI [Thermodesulfobacteriota bacterium]
MSTKKYYAVAKGRKPGVYTSWPVAKAQVHGFPGARYKGFPTWEEANSWLAKPISSKRVVQTGSKSKTHPDQAETTPKKGEVTIYTDGGARFNPGPGGYGIVQIYDGHCKELAGGYKLTTNNRMELMACIVALQNLEYRDKPVILYSDSSYVVNGINKGWAKNWRARGWIKSDKKPAVNPDLWAQLLDLCENLDVTFRWVKGHAGNPLNERCDELAVASWQKDNLPIDNGYQEVT